MHHVYILIMTLKEQIVQEYNITPTFSIPL